MTINGEADQSHMPELCHCETDVSAGAAKKHFAGNSASNIVYFLFNIATSFFMIPYQLSHLGIANYGMVTLANSFVSYTQVLTVVVVSMLFRFVTLHLARGDVDTARSYFNTQFAALVWFAAIFVPIAAVISYATPAFLRIPPGQADNTRILFFLMYLSFLLVLMSNPFRLAMFASQRFDICNWVDIGSQITRYGTWIVLFALLKPASWNIGLGFAAGAAITLVCHMVVSRPLMRHLRPTVREFDRAKFSEMCKTGAWVVVSQVGTLVYLSIDALVINRMLGPTSVGKYCTILGIALMLRGLFSTMSGMMTPVAIASYAKGDFDTLARHMSRAVKFVSLGAALLLAAVCGFASPFLSWWLGPEFRILYPLVWWLLAHMVITSGVEPLHSVNLAANRMAVPGVATVIGGILKLVAAILLVKFTSLGFYGVAIAGTVSLVLLHVCFTPLYVGRTLRMSSLPFYKALVPSVLTFAVASTLAAQVALRLSLATFPRLALSISALFVIFGTAAYFLALSGDDREFLKGISPFGKKKRAQGG